MDDPGEGWAAFGREEYAASERLFREMLTAPDITEAERRQARFNLGYVLAFMGQHDEVRETFHGLRVDARQRQDAECEHVSLHQMGMMERMAGRWAEAEAEATFKEETALVAALGSPALAVSVNAYERGTVALHLGRAAEARRWLELALETARESGDPIAVGCAHRALGDWCLQERQPDRASALFLTALQTFADAGDGRAALDAQRRLDDLAAATPPLSSAPESPR